MKVLVSKLIEEALEYWPKIIFCDDMEIKGKDAIIPYLTTYGDDWYIHVEDYEQMTLIKMVFDCIFDEFQAKAVEMYKANGSCHLVHQKDLDLHAIVHRIKGRIKRYYLKYFRDENIKIIYDIKSTQKLDNINTKS